MMKHFAYLILPMLLILSVTCASAQQRSYPEDMLNIEEATFITVKYKGASPSIVDFINALINEEDGIGMPMDSGNIIDAWNHYLRNEKQEPGVEVVVDKKNGYVRITTEYTEDYDGEHHVYKGYFESCFWNCADGKHKLFAININSSNNGRYIEGQTTGLSLSLYDNGRHIMWDINEEEVGLDVAPIPDEYEYNAETELYYIKDYETGKQLTLNNDEFWRWRKKRPIKVFWLPQQGKDIICEIHSGSKCDTFKHVWDGMRFNQQ